MECFLWFYADCLLSMSHRSECFVISQSSAGTVRDEQHKSVGDDKATTYIRSLMDSQPLCIQKCTM